MRFVVAIASLAAVLTARATAMADVEKDAVPTRPVVERCLELPMSLAFDVTEREASRSLRPDSLMSDGRVVVATPAPPRLDVPNDAPRPFSPSPRACQSPDDPRCHVTAPPPTPRGIHLDHAVRAIAPFPAPYIVPATGVVAVLPILPGADGPREAHARGVFRPPA